MRPSNWPRLKKPGFPYSGSNKHDREPSARVGSRCSGGSAYTKGFAIWGRKRWPRLMPILACLTPPRGGCWLAFHFFFAECGVALPPARAASERNIRWAHVPPPVRPLVATVLQAPLAASHMCGRARLKAGNELGGAQRWGERGFVLHMAAQFWCLERGADSVRIQVPPAPAVRGPNFG